MDQWLQVPKLHFRGCPHVRFAECYIRVHHQGGDSWLIDPIRAIYVICAHLLLLSEDNKVAGGLKRDTYLCERAHLRCIGGWGWAGGRPLRTKAAEWHGASWSWWRSFYVTFFLVAARRNWRRSISSVWDISSPKNDDDVYVYSTMNFFWSLPKM